MKYKHSKTFKISAELREHTDESVFKAVEDYFIRETIIEALAFGLDKQDAMWQAIVKDVSDTDISVLSEMFDVDSFERDIVAYGDMFPWLQEEAKRQAAAGMKDFVVTIELDVKP